MKVHAIRTGSVRIKSAQVERGRLGPASVFLDSVWSDWLPTFAFAIEHDEGVIVVDTGQSAHLLEQPGQSAHPYLRWEVMFRIEREEEIGPQLRALGISSRDVTDVVLTHLHVDHDAGLLHFPQSRIRVDRGEIAKASGMMGRLRGYLPQRWPTWFEPIPLDLDDGPVGAFAASKRLTGNGDIVAVATPGHTSGHLSVLVLDGDAALLIAGDASYTERLMMDDKIDGVSGDTRAARATLAAIRAYAASSPLIYLPTHDPGSADRLARRQTVQVAR